MAGISVSKYEMAVAAKNRAVARAREVRGGSGGYRGVAGACGGTAVAGVIDAKMGEGTATYVGLAAAVAGVALGMPDALHVGSGLLQPAIYRASRAQAEKYFGAPAPVKA
jgi:hypothetical protein